MGTLRLENLVYEDFGLLYDGPRYAKARLHDSLVVDKEKQMFYWNSRGLYGDVIDYLVKVRGYSKNKAMQLLKSSHKKYLRKINKHREEKPSLFIVEHFHYNLMETQRFDYLNRRFIKLSTVRQYKIGMFSRFGIDFYTFPVYEFGEIVNIQVRTDKLPSGNKIIYKMYRRGFPSVMNSLILRFGIKSVYFTEGLVDCIFLNQEGFPAVATDSGLSWHDRFYEIFYDIETIYLIQDNDKAGYQAARRFLKKFGREKLKIFNWSLLNGVEEKEDVISFYRKFKSLEPLVNPDNYM